jgi:protein-tyrosine-phosphatase
MNILFVCTGNVSRSFLAAALLRDQIERLGLDHISVASAGLAAYPGSPADPKMVDYLQENGIPVTDHSARQIQKEDVDWADLIIVMEKEQAGNILELWPEANAKVDLLGKYMTDPHIPDDVIDPFGRSPYHYRLAQAQITMGIESLMKKLTQKTSR